MTPGHTQLILMLSFEYLTTSTRYPNSTGRNSHINSIALRHRYDSCFGGTARSYEFSFSSPIRAVWEWYSRALGLDTIPS